MKYFMKTWAEDLKKFLYHPYVKAAGVGIEIPQNKGSPLRVELFEKHGKICVWSSEGRMYPIRRGENELEIGVTL